MTASTSLLDMILNLLRNPSDMAAFQDDPEGWLASCGAENVGPADIHDALVLIQDNQDADFSREHNTGGNHIQVPPPPAPHPGESEHETAVRYLNNYVTTNNYIDDRDTTVDNSVNQQVDTHGGDFDQNIDIDNVTASGDGAVAAGGDIEDSTVVTGDDNQVGDDNVRGDHNVVGDDNEVLQGDGNTASFGDGDANSATFNDTNVGTGGAIAVGGDADGDYDVDGSYNEATATTTNTTTTDYDDSFNSHNESTVGSHNDTDTNVDVDSHDDTHTDVLSHNDVDIDS